MLGRKARAGVYAERRYQRGLRSWRSKNRRLFVTLCGPFVAAGIVVGVLERDLVAWGGGLLAGAFLAIWISFQDSPPRYVETWGEGAKGEREAEKALRPLERSGGWQVFHDVQNGHGNYDHIVVGAAGVYLLESKNLEGIVEIRGGVPHLARRHDPEQTVVFKRVRPSALASAARLKKEIEEQTGKRTWVQAVVVFWSEFPAGLLEDDRCVFIEGSRLREWLEDRPIQLSAADVEGIAAGVRGIAEDAEAGVPVSSAIARPV